MTEGRYRSYGSRLRNATVGGSAIAVPPTVAAHERAGETGAWLADEGQVVVATGGVRDRGAAVGRDAQRGAVGVGAAIDGHRAVGVAHADGAAGVAAAVDVTNGHRAAIGGCGRNAAVTGGSGIRVLHDRSPSRWPPSEPFHSCIASL